MPSVLNPPVDVRLTVLPDVPCPYLPGRQQRLRAVNASSIDGDTYRAFMDVGFRRSGRMLYQNVCEGCQACVPLRVDIRAFAPSASQRRCARRNTDLTVVTDRPALSDEKFDLYARYVRLWHGRDSDADYESLETFLYDSPTKTIEFSYRDAADRLLAVGICDVSAASLSSVYFYFDPAEAQRGLGTFGALYEIDFCRKRQIPYYYLGFWVKDCAAMTYKANFRPNELLDETGTWRPAGDAPA